MDGSQAAYVWRRTLRAGMRGRDVALLQEHLSRLGYYRRDLDGVFGLLTKEALRNFQKAHRLRADGIAGKQVFAVLRSGQALPEVRHTAGRSETLSAIARVHDIPMDLLLRANRIEGARVREGQCLVIPVSRLVCYYAGHEDADSSYESYEKHLACISAVAPRWFRLNPDGSVSGEPARKVLALASLAGIAVYPVVATEPPGSAPSPLHEMLIDAIARRKAAKAITEAAVRSRAQGLILSVGRLVPEDSYAFTSFTRELARTVAGTGRSLAVDVPLPDDGGAGALASPVEYREVVQVASRVIVRAYTEPGDLLSPGPVGSLVRARAALKVLTRVVPPWKLILAVPVFGIDFSAAPGAPPLRKKHREVADILDIFRPSVARTEPAGPSTFRYRSFRVNHTVFFEDAASIGAYADLALRYRLAGLAVADLGEEDPGAWDAIRTRFKVLRGAARPVAANQTSGDWLAEST